jgi:methionine sulfoxide reductase heme-binding subunit
MATAVTPHLFWIMSRAAGSAALVLSSLAVCLGLMMGGRFVKKRGLDLRSTHEALSLATLATLVVHVVALFGDGYLSPTVLDLTIPFVSGYMTFYTSVGIVAGWSLAALGLSYYLRDRIGPARWRKLHRFTALAWILGLVHSLGEGTDAGTAWFLAMTAIVVVPALALLVARMLPRSRGREVAAQAAVRA